MPEKRAPKKAPAATKAPVTKKKAAAPRRTATPVKAEAAAAAPAPTGGVCPRCGTAKFGPEQRIRAEGDRTVRYTILVCERGHTFARPRSR